jgi:hypothetical protein
MQDNGLSLLSVDVIRPASAGSLGGFVADRTVVHTDGWQGYAGLKAAGFDHRVHRQLTDHRVNGRKVAHPDRQFVLPRAHRAISNPKTWLQGTHHGVSPEHLQVYLERVRLPPQAQAHTSRHLPDAARTRSAARANDPPPNHPPTTPNGADRIVMTAGIGCGLGRRPSSTIPRPRAHAAAESTI